MADIVDSAKRSSMMAAIQGRNTKPERQLRSILHAAGFRFRLHVKDLPGKPDLFLPRYNAVIQVHGCFWHRHEGCRFCTIPTSNGTFWRMKFEQNVARDKRNHQLLRERGLRVGTVWECALKSTPPEELKSDLSEWLRGTNATLELPAQS